MLFLKENSIKIFTLSLFALLTMPLHLRAEDLLSFEYTGTALTTDLTIKLKFDLLNGYTEVEERCGSTGVWSCEGDVCETRYVYTCGRDQIPSYVDKAIELNLKINTASNNQVSSVRQYNVKIKNLNLNSLTSDQILSNIEVKLVSKFTSSSCATWKFNEISLSSDGSRLDATMEIKPLVESSRRMRRNGADCSGNI